MMMKTELVFVPAPGRGHTASIIGFAKQLLEREERKSVTVLVIKRATPPKLDSYIEKLAAANSNIRFINLPSVDPPSPEPVSSIEKFTAVLLRSTKPSSKMP
ncbi:unnamed protein product [Coffea canephora]|uniref:DH200=94 genomic scaffold, scaffold_245 n=1 Tax=Coffea canephora TaxID=49390 RepID=A0A068VD34_COFCA|nr:unnamed protein product [Coffea canephora]